MLDKDWIRKYVILVSDVLPLVCCIFGDATVDCQLSYSYHIMHGLPYLNMETAPRCNDIAPRLDYGSQVGPWRCD